MTTADQLALVNKLLQPPEEAHTLVQAGLVIDWVKSRRLLVLVRLGREQSLFVVTCQQYPVSSLGELSVDLAIPIDSQFKFDLDSAQSSGPDAVYVTVTSQKQKFLFEMLPGYHTQNFVSEIYRLTENVSKQIETNSGSRAFDWLDKYKSSESSSQCSVASSDVTDEMDSLAETLPRMDIATGAAQPIVGRDRESVVMYQMSTKEELFTDVQTFKFFMGTYNVNGQRPDRHLKDWLAVDEDAPDLYAIGFQELDLSKEAFVFMESEREAEWTMVVSASLHKDAKYVLVKSVRLVGMMLLLYTRQELQHHLTNLSVDTVGTGIMGKLGNKGGVGVRFRFHATDLCIVNSHLAAHQEEYERRNQDYNDICSRMEFTQYEKLCPDYSPMLNFKRIKDHEMTFWLGDLNYRLNDLEVSEVKEQLEEGSLSLLLESDQFSLQRQQRKAFVGYKEGPIKFRPTYKYDPGTSNWDSSEKCRPPAWTDRILWRGETVSQTDYRSHEKLTVSDHKPVSAVFNVGVKVIDKARRQRIKEEIMKKLDMLENDFLPQVMVDQTDIIFDEVRFMESFFRTLAIANTGQVPVQFEFIKKPGESSYARPWLVAEPNSGFIMPGEKADVSIEIYVDKRTAHSLNCGEDKLYDILVLHLMGGKDIFITVSGSYTKSSFGCSLEALVHLTVPIAELSPGQVVSLEKGSLEMLPPETTDGQHEPYPVPKELWFLCDLLTNLGLHREHLFIHPALKQEILMLRDWLDTGKPLTPPQVSIHSAAEALMTFLASLREPIIPYTMYSRSLECSANYLQCKQLVSQLPPHHKQVFDYLTAFLREVITHSAQNGIDPKILATLFCSIFLRDPPGTNLGVGARAKVNQQLLERKKAAFIFHFIVNEPDD